MPALPLKEYQRKSPDAIGRFCDAVRLRGGAATGLTHRSAGPCAPRKEDAGDKPPRYGPRQAGMRVAGLGTAHPAAKRRAATQGCPYGEPVRRAVVGPALRGRPCRGSGLAAGVWNENTTGEYG